jgi:hypothetical protein
MYEHLLEESVKAAKPAPRSDAGSAALGTTLRARVVIPDPAMVIKTGIETETETETETGTETGTETETEMGDSSISLTGIAFFVYVSVSTTITSISPRSPLR